MLSHKDYILPSSYIFFKKIQNEYIERQTQCNGESCLTESPDQGFKEASPNLQGEGMSALEHSDGHLNW
jgi:hypothetical protein